MPVRKVKFQLLFGGFNDKVANVSTHKPNFNLAQCLFAG